MTPGMGSWPIPGVNQVVAPPAAFSRGKSYAAETAVPHPSMQYGGFYSFGGTAECLLTPPSSIHSGKGFFPGLLPPDDTVNSKSVVRVKHGDSGE